MLLAAYRGQGTLAQETLATVRPETADSADHSVRSWYKRVTAVVRLMAGDLPSAYDEAMGALTNEPGGVNSNLATCTGGHAAIWLHDPERATALLATSEEPDSGWGRAVRQSIRAGILALEGNPGDAAQLYDSVLAGRLAIGDRFSHALIVIDAATVLPTHRLPEGAVEAATGYLAEIGAVPLRARLEAAVARQAQDPVAGRV